MRRGKAHQDVRQNSFHPRLHPGRLHRNPSYFSPFPETFWPDRWLPGSQQTDPTTHPVVLEPSAFIPFSIGPTSCAGKNLALMELRIVTCFVLQHFHVRIACKIILS